MQLVFPYQLNGSTAYCLIGVSYFFVVSCFRDQIQGLYHESPKYRKHEENQKPYNLAYWSLVLGYNLQLVTCNMQLATGFSLPA
jgi:hypothetical protein